MHKTPTNFAKEMQKPEKKHGCIPPAKTSVFNENGRKLDQIVSAKL